MITFEPTVFCDGDTVLGRVGHLRSTDLGRVANLSSVQLPLPQGWLTVLKAGDGRKHFCPECAVMWREREHAARKTVTPEELESFRDECAAFDWAYAFTDDHGYYVERDRELQAMRRRAERHPELMAVFKARGKQVGSTESRPTENKEVA